MRGPDAPEAHAAALAGLAGMTPVRLALLTDGFAPVTAWRALRAGTHPGDPRRRFLLDARRTDVEGVARRYAAAGVTVALPGGRGYPGMLTGDPGAPAVLFALGGPDGSRSRPPGGRRRDPFRHALRPAGCVGAGVGSGHGGRDHRVRAGPGDRCRRPCRRGQGGRRSGRRAPGGSGGDGSGRGLSGVEQGPVGRGRRPRGRAVRVAAGHPGPPEGVPGTQPHHRRPVGCGGRRREPLPGWLALHRRSGGAPVDPGVRGAGLGEERILVRYERASSSTAASRCATPPTCWSPWRWRVPAVTARSASPGRTVPAADGGVPPIPAIRPIRPGESLEVGPIPPWTPMG